MKRFVRTPARHLACAVSLLWAYLLVASLPYATAGTVIIDEFMASNDRTLLDVDGDKSDWLELFNGGAQSVNLAGWSLSDDPAKPQKWRFPALNLAKGTYLLVWASGKNRTNAATPLHTNFKLSSNAGSYLALSDASSNLVSVFASYPAQYTDVSYGVDTANPTNVGYFASPTPGGPNTSLGAGFSPPVIFSQTGRTYVGTLTLTLSTASSKAVIHYTTDGTAPTEQSTVYTKPLSLTTATEVRAQAFLGGFLPSPIHTEMFIPLSQPIANFTSDLPVMIIHDLGQGGPPIGYDIPAYFEIFDRGTNGLTSLTNAPVTTARAIVGARGSSTLFDSKVSMKVEFHDEEENSLNVPLLGLPANSDWVLYGIDGFEPVLIHNPFAHQLSRDIGRYSSRTRFVEVYLVQTGFGPVSQSDYNGIYVLEEKIKLGADRVDAPKLEPGQNTAPEVTGGYLLKIDRPGPGESGFSSGHQQVVFDSPQESDITQPDRSGQYDYITTYVKQLDAALYGTNFRDPVKGYRAYVDVDSWIDHHLLNVLTFNVDALRLSAYFYKQRDGKLFFGPLWDFDRSLNSTDGRDANPKVWRSQVGDLGTDFFNYVWWVRMFRDPDFFQQYIDRYEALRRNQFSTTNLWRLVDDLTSQVRKAQPREQARWGVVPRGGYQGEINSLKNWLSNRTAFIDSQFVAPATFATPGQTVSNGFQLVLNVPVGTTVYYTLDGSDPRPQGTSGGNDIGTNALVYNGPIALTANARVMARARNPDFTSRVGANNPPLRSFWSGPIVDTYVVDPYPILVSEIMYHPAGDGNSTIYGAKDFEFIELKNNGPKPVSLPGFVLGGTANFRFAATNPITTLPSGGRAVLVNNAAAFKTRYPSVTNVIGEYSGSLGNNSGKLSLTGPLQEPVFNFSYSAAWQTNTDGGGYSLVLADEAIDPGALGNNTSWTTSAILGGSPGGLDAATIQPVKVSLSQTQSSAVLRFKGVVGKAYTVQVSAGLSQADWQTFRVVTTPGNGSNEVPIPFGQAAQFFRVLSQ